MAGSTRRNSESDELPGDIRQRARDDFGPEHGDSVYRYLVDRVPEGLPNGTRPRHLRCILHLARGDRAALERFIEVCLQDPRDVMFEAEYENRLDAEPVRVRDFGKPFERSEIGGRAEGTE